jgi:signal transduction histidine kinase
MILRRLWPIVRALWLPFLMIGLAYLLLREPLTSWLQGDDRYDQEAIAEWVREARLHQTLPDLAKEYLQLKDDYLDLEAKAHSADPTVRPSDDDIRAAKHQLDSKHEQIEVHLQSMCDAVTKVYPGKLPLFVVVYRVTVRFDDGEKPIVWDSGKPRQPKQYRQLPPIKLAPNLPAPQPGRGIWADVDYQARVYARQQFNERQAIARWRWLSGLGLLLATVASVWFFLRLRRQRDRELRHLQAEQQASAADRLRLEEALKRQEAERRQEEAERTALELKSQLFANIGIMAGSYAHNIKNLLVRPNDLLGRCLEQDGLPPEHDHMLHEVRQTLGTVTERLQQILQTVRRDPSRSERQLLDLNELVREMHDTWTEMAQSKWKLDLHLELADTAGPLWIDGDRSHLQQALENLLFNARDATFEMRNHLRNQARHEPSDGATADARKQALIAAAGWKGQVWLRTRRDGDRAVLEVEDNGIGMTEEVRRRCTQTHFSTKRDNALFAGLSAGMGLGLSFVAVILEHHQATLEITSDPLQGARFRVTFPLGSPSPPAPAGDGRVQKFDSNHPPPTDPNR